MPHASVDKTDTLALQVSPLLTEVAALVAATGDSDHLAASVCLQTTLRELLWARSDAVLEAAFQALAQAQDEAGLDTLQRTLERVTERFMYTKGASALFVIPVTGLLPNHAEVSYGHLGPKSAVGEIGEAIKEAGLLGEHGLVGVLPYLYHPEELLRLSYGDIHALHDALLRGSALGVPVAPEVLGQTGWPATPDSGPVELHLGLRYLVGFVFDTSHNPILLDDRLHQATPEYLVKLGEVVRQATPAALSLVQQFHPQARCQIEHPQLFFHGRRAGLAEFAQLAMDLALAADLETAGVSPRGARAVVSPVVENDRLTGVRVSAVSRLTGDLICAHTRAVYRFENPRVLLEALLKRLVDFTGFAAVELKQPASADQRAWPSFSTTPERPPTLH